VRSQKRLGLRVDVSQEWGMIEAESIRLNMSKAFFVHLAVTNAIGKFKPIPRFDYSDFVSDGETKECGDETIYQIA
jgi:hypothetical protein